MQTIVQLDYAAKQNLLYNFKSKFNKFLHEVVATRNDFPVDTKAMEDDDGRDEDVESDRMELMLSRSIMSLSPNEAVRDALHRIKKDVESKQKDKKWDDDVQKMQ